MREGRGGREGKKIEFEKIRKRFDGPRIEAVRALPPLKGLRASPNKTDPLKKRVLCLAETREWS